jgi:hypothetical protein
MENKMMRGNISYVRKSTVSRFMLPVFIFFFGIICSCEKENMCDCTKSTGPIVTEKRSLQSFHRLEVRKNVVVTLYQDTIEYVEVEAGSHLIDLVVTEVNNGVLLITNLNKCNWVRSYDIEIHARVHVKKLDYIDHFGAREINCADTLLIDYIDIRQNNSSDIHLLMKANQVYARQMAGGGDIYLSGSSDFCYTFAGSFGYIYAGDLVSQSVNVDHRSTGEIHVHAISDLRVYIEGKGNVFYQGSPVIDSEIKGAGKLIPED